MRSCRRVHEVHEAVAANEPLAAELAAHVAACSECQVELAAARRIDHQLQAAIDARIQDALPPATLVAASDALRLPAARPTLRRLASGVAAVAITLFAVVGVAATGASLSGVITGNGNLDPDGVHRDFTACYTEEVHTASSDRAGDFAVVVERCLGDESDSFTTRGYEVVAVFNREAEAATACLSGRGWDIEPVLEPGGRFLVPPPDPPAGEDAERYHDDLEACSAESTDQIWGPMAVVTSTGDMARNEGTLLITDQCVFLERDGERWLLAWPANRIGWNGEDESIAFTTLSGDHVMLRTGDAVVLAGGGSSAAEDGLDFEDWTANMDWVQAPDPSCAADLRWFVSDVVGD